ncbi:MAG: hypothetical protein ABSC29_00730 [Minisyncoccia bacterium]|jgi:hypothetical protein
MRFGRSIAIAVAASAVAVLFFYPVMVAGGGIHEGTEVKPILISWDCGRLRVEAAGRLLDENKPVPTEEEAPYATLSYVIDMDRRTMSDGRTEESFSPQEAGIIRPFLNIAERYFGDVLGEPPTSFAWSPDVGPVAKVTTKGGEALINFQASMMIKGKASQPERITAYGNHTVWIAINAVQVYCMESVEWWINQRGHAPSLPSPRLRRHKPSTPEEPPPAEVLPNRISGTARGAVHFRPRTLWGGLLCKK